MSLLPDTASSYRSLVMAGILVLWLFGGALLTAQAATAYNFPGNLPSGCSASNANYTCGSLSLSFGDTLVFGSPRPATLTINGNLSTSNAQINATGNLGDLKLVVTGVLSAGSGATLNADVTAGSVTNVLGNTTFKGSVTTTTGNIQLGDYSHVIGRVVSTSGTVLAGNFVTIDAEISSSAPITIGDSSQVGGDITSAAGAVTVGVSSTVSGNISAGAAITLSANSQAARCTKSTGTVPLITIGPGAVVNSVCCGAAACNNRCVVLGALLTPPPLCPMPAAGPHHLEIRHGTGSGLTCSPSRLTVAACQDANCSTPYTAGVTGSLSASGTGMVVNWPTGAAFTIPPGSSTTTEDVQVTTPGTVVLGVSGASPASVIATTCNFGNPSCNFTVADAGFIFNVPDHVSGVVQSVDIRAVRKSDSSAACVPAFTGNKTVAFSCAYVNPVSGTVPVQVGGAARACGGSGNPVVLAFNASGVAATAVQYADAGQVRLDARYSGSGNDAGLMMIGSNNFIAAPASFGISAISAGPIKAGSPFGATVTALSNTGTVTPNFGAETTPESTTVAFTRAQPTGSGARNGVFTGSLDGFSAGAVSTNNLIWSEVGRGDLNVTLTSGNYLGSVLSVTGTTGSAGAIGRFIPDHFDVVVTPACGVFSYAAQPFSVNITARNGLIPADTTFNYDASNTTTPNFAKNVALRDAPALGLGSFTGGDLPASLFSAGMATASTPAYTFTTKLTPEKPMTVRATDTDAVGSAGHAEGSTLLRSGRLRLSNAFGSEKSALALAVQAQYWSGNAWVLNRADSCSVVPAPAVVRSGYADNKGAPTSAWSTTASSIVLAGGNATLILSAPSPVLTGSVDLALNLGSTAADQSCLATHPASTGGALPWLRSQNGGCSSAWDRDPSARATFGIYSPESRKILHVRELF